MKGYTVDIADFRCRGIARATAFQHRPTRGLHAASGGVADSREEAAVYDIEVEAQRLRRRNKTLESMTVGHKAKVLRFRNAVPVQMELRIEQARGAERWSALPNSSCDPPPAA